ncbi:MAG: DUF2974 domain-containing protein [Atopobiaceae bacterium]|jgi:pimeloyl-ACP methyl ester carboxylesterase|nr:DUF2974 domain-containing protein [Atopobiaceae bacterium]MCI2174123.1 DUF2974 domain-containing protein [Atopobiaceae bacterium]MCI2206764.1 DUF2974 domain-containing protein [Atopobiaceae bacterium]
MPNISGYLDWRGDVSIDASPFNVVDNMILSELAYVDMGPIAADVANDSGLPLGEAVERLTESGFESRCLSKIPKDFLLKVGDSTRFGNVRVTNYVDILDHDSNCQFSAMTFDLANGTYYVAFRGTDMSTVGWRENFMMSFEVTTAQRRASDYLADIIRRHGPARFLVGGHSKGGNLAVYAAATVDDKCRERIVSVYDNDGPGMCEDVVEPSRIAGISQRIVKTVPQFSVVGMLFPSTIPFRICRSSASGIEQHGLMTWEVRGTDVVQASRLSEAARRIDEGIDGWIRNETLEGREEFVHRTFDVLEEDGARSLADAVPDADGLERVIFGFASSGAGVRSMAGRLFSSLAAQAQQIDLVSLVRERNALLGAGMVVLSLFMLRYIDSSYRIVETGIFFVLGLLMASRLAHNLCMTDMSEQRRRLVCAVDAVGLVIAIVVCLFVRTGAPMSILLGTSLIAYGLMCHRRLGGRRPTRVELFQIVASCAMGVIVLVLPYDFRDWYLYGTGTLLLVLGTIELARAARGLASVRVGESDD